MAQRRTEVPACHVGLQPTGSERVAGGNGLCQGARVSMATATVVGTLIGLALADDPLTALIGSRIYRDVQPEENPLPFVEGSDGDEVTWITTRHRIEKHHVTARVYAPAGATVGADNQAVVIADNL